MGKGKSQDQEWKKTKEIKEAKIEQKGEAKINCKTLCRFSRFVSLFHVIV